MQFKHPEVLWALLLLLIPILVHLLRLRRFKVTPFTNVAMLQSVISESKRSDSIKKWLLLFSRLFLLAALIFAFAQPFSADKNASKDYETVFYLDNSFSMQLRQGGLTLLEKAVQDFIKGIPKNLVFNLFTNDRTYNGVTIDQVQNELLSIDATAKQLNWEQIKLKAQGFFSSDSATLKDLVVISDFQDRLGISNHEGAKARERLVRLVPDRAGNVSIDSIYFGDSNGDQVQLHVVVKGLAKEASTPISLFNGNRLIAKTTVHGKGQRQDEIVLTLQANDFILGRLQIEDNQLDYDNVFFFNQDRPIKPKVLAISATNNPFLPKIYSETEFEFKQVQLDQLNYSEIENQNLIILNELEELPNALIEGVRKFNQNGGTVCVIPSMGELNKSSYRRLFTGKIPISLDSVIAQERMIDRINEQHPLYKRVFQKPVSNFNYPSVYAYWKSKNRASTILSYSNAEPFLVEENGVYVFTASLVNANSNFSENPLIVPTFYSMGLNSLRSNEPFHRLGKTNQVDVAENLEGDGILKLRSTSHEFIPRQQQFSNKVSLFFSEELDHDGIFSVMHENDTLRNISFNHDRLESNLTYTPTESFEGIEISDSLPSYFSLVRSETKVNGFWKWFVIAALLFAVIEMLIQKFVK